MKFAYLLLIPILLTSCVQKQNNSLFYVIAKHKPFNKNEHIMFYGCHNIILYNDTTIYYHPINTRICGRCGTGLDFTKPPFFDLTPGKLKRIELRDLAFYWKKWSKKKQEMKYIIVSSPTDTIRNPALLKLKQLSGYNKKVMIGINKCTEEQLHVSKAKFENKSYDAKKIKWEIGFDDDGISIDLPKVLDFVPTIKN